MRIEDEIKLDYSDVLIRPKRSTLGSRKEVDLEINYSFRNIESDSVGNHFHGVPIMAANMDGVGTFEMADKLAEHLMFTCLVKTYSVESLTEFFSQTSIVRTNHVAMSIGISKTDLAKFKKVYANVGDRLRYVCIDVANGYSERFTDFVKQFRKNNPEIIIIAGNVVTADQTQELIMNGADIVKVGIGPGSVCTTRIKTGVGYPQLSAVIECADAAHGLGGHIIADGGCTTPGDVIKAFAGGADFVMLGGMLAGHDEGGGDIITKFYETNELEYEIGGHLSNRVKKIEEKKFIKFYGMSSEEANTKHFGGLKEYRSSEGRETSVPYRGGVDITIRDCLGGIRSACTYVGADRLKNLSKCATFIRCGDTHNRVFENNNA